VTKSGIFTLNTGTSAFKIDPAQGGFSTLMSVAGTSVVVLNTAPGVAVANGGYLGIFGPGSIDVTLYRDAADTLALRRGTNAQTFNWYATWTDASNYEGGYLTAAAGSVTIGARTAGSGTDNIDVVLVAPGTGIVRTDAPMRVRESATDYLDIGQGTSRSNIAYASNGLGQHYSLQGDTTGSSGPAWLKFGSGGLVSFQSTTRSDSGTPDTAFGRAAAKVFELGGDGGAGAAPTVGATFRSIPTTPAQITGNQDNYNPGGSSYVQRWSSDASRQVTGMTFTAAQVNGQQHVIVNVGSADIVLMEQVTSTAANQFLNSTGADITLEAKKAAYVFYDGTVSRWRVFKMN
jgi:hypothetical protein